MRRRTLLALAAALALTGCGGGTAPPRPLGVVTSSATPDAAAQAAGGCSTTPTSDPLPSIMPPELTLPEGTVVTSSTERDPYATITGLVPGDLDAVRAKFKTSIEGAKLPIQSEDYEGFEAEYFFGTLDLQGVVRVVRQECLQGSTSFALSLQSGR